MADQRVHVSGLKELGKAMEALSNKVAKKIARTAVQAGGRSLRKLARSKAPIAPEPYRVRANKADKTGVLVLPKNIQKNIVVKNVKNTQFTAEAHVSIRGKRINGYANRVAILQEFGTVNAPPQPFMRPTFDEGRMPAVELVKQKLQEGIAKAVAAGPVP